MDKEPLKKKKVFVGLSGGVDSSVSVLLLHKQGYDVTGVFIKTWYPDFIPCNWKQEMRDAMRVCARIGIPFLVCDLTDEYKKEIIDNLIQEYSKGNTPNPDVLCNQKIKFGAYLDWAIKNGADYVATGHYAQNLKNSGLFKSQDQNKDQTYFLWTIRHSLFAKILFPIGHLKKDEVRKIAQKNNLHTATKKDSQGLCFIGQVDIKDFLKRYIQTTQGDVVDESGQVTGKHDGAELYTFGERHGFVINDDLEKRAPHYVIRKDLKKNTITVSDQQQNDSRITQSTFGFTNFIVSDLQTIIGDTDLVIESRTKYRGPLHKSRLIFEKDKTTVRFETPIDAVAPGQSIVFYYKDQCLGGGIVESTR